MSERWLPVVDYEGLYEVSDLGRVRSLDRTETINNRWGPMTRVKKGRVLSPGRRRGYMTVDLRAPGERPRHHLVHRLVARAFLGPHSDGKGLVLHRNDDPSDNRVSNLRWGNASDNSRDAVRNGVHGQGRKTHCRQGHEYTDANTLYRPNGYRRCRECTRAWNRKAAL